jgi:hypothetical protein
LHKFFEMSREKISLDIDTLLDTFNLSYNYSCEQLSEWLKVNGELSPLHQELLESVHHRIKTNGDFWNEEELKINVIGFLMYVADLEVEGKIKTFFERNLSTTFGDKEISVKCDCMVATPKGKGTPKTPYFFLQEYKKQKGDKNDPEGQMLGAMLIAQEINQDGKTIYGCYLVGRNWYFTTLIGKNYCISRQFDAQNYDDLLQIVFILRKLKNLILDR